MGTEQQTHRPGAYKQTNKAHKTGRHRSKGAIEAALRGKSSIKAVSHKHKQIQKREQRRNQLMQIRKNKRQEVMAKKRQLGGESTAPFLTCILPLNSEIDSKSALSIIQHGEGDMVLHRSLPNITYINANNLKMRYSFVTPPIGRDTELTILDYLKVCDSTLILTSAALEEIFDQWGFKMFDMICAQGLPTPLTTLMDLESVNPKKRILVKADIQKFISRVLPDEKLISMNSSVILQRVGALKRNVLRNKENRPHMLGEVVEFVADSTGVNGTLKVTGFLRGTPLDVNGLVHIPGLGDFQMSQIDSIRDPYKTDKRKGKDDTVDEGQDTKVVAVADPTKQVPLQRENIPDEMDAEQTWPTEEEIQLETEKTKKIKLIKKIPKGMGEYQANWIPEEEVEESDEDESDDDDDEEEDDFMSCDSEKNSDDEMNGSQNNDNDDDEEFLETVSVSDAPVNDEKYDLAMDLYEERETLQKIKEARADQMWADEIDTPQDVEARDRFQKYRGLESFRTSPWDRKENLPADYARIYQFKNFDRTKRRILNEISDAEGVLPGLYITIHVKNVPLDKWQSYKITRKTDDVVVYGLLPHEHQMSVVNVILKRTPDSEVPIKSKEKLIIQCGYRRFVVNPIFSQHTNGDKHKYERFFRANSTVVATFYAPIQFPPAPILCFKENPNKSLALVARGSLLSCNPNRIILKRIVLSGHPFKINRKAATIRYMFYNKLDVEYFKPIRLRTKCGRIGHIKESLGTHGHMKCVFDGQLKSFDTVFLYLYKRVFPKWTYEDYMIPSTDIVEMQT